MDFEYTSYISIASRDLRNMYKRVKNGENFDDVFNDIMSGYDDVDFYASDYIKDDVYKEILRRLNQNN